MVRFVVSELGAVWLDGHGLLGLMSSGGAWQGGSVQVVIRLVKAVWLGVVTQTSKIVRKLCGGKTNGLFLEEDEAADYG